MFSHIRFVNLLLEYENLINNSSYFKNYDKIDLMIILIKINSIAFSM